MGGEEWWKGRGGKGKGEGGKGRGGKESKRREGINLPHGRLRELAALVLVIRFHKKIINE